MTEADKFCSNRRTACLVSDENSACGDYLLDTTRRLVVTSKSVCPTTVPDGGGSILFGQDRTASLWIMRP